MPKIITNNQIRKITDLIRAWPSDISLNWNRICLEAQLILNWKNPPTRQALDKKPAIKFAYNARKEYLKAEKNKMSTIPRPRSMLDAIKKIHHLQAENDALKAELSKMAEIANRFIYNASIAGLSRDKLMAQLPVISPLVNKNKAKKGADAKWNENSR